MALTKAILRRRVRNKIKAWYEEQDAINDGTGISSSDTSVVVDDGTKFNKGDLIDVESETMLITNVSTNTLTVIRGHQGTTAATHADDTIVYRVNYWSQAEINEAIESAFEELHDQIYNEYKNDFKGQSNRRQIDDCDTANWAEANDAIAETVDTANQQEGSGCLNLGATYSAGYATYSKAITSFDITNYEYLCFWFYVKEKLDTSDNPYLAENAIEIKLGNDSSNYETLTVGRDELSAGSWNLLVLNLQDVTTTGTLVKTAIDYLAIKINVAQTITLGDIKIDEIFLTTYPITTNKLEYRLPTGVFWVNEIRIFESEDSINYARLDAWKQDGNYLILNKEAVLRTKEGTLFNSVGTTSHYPLQILGNKKLTVPTSDSTTIDLDETKGQLIVLGASIQLIENMFAEKIRFDKYSTKVERQGGSVLDLVRTENQIRSRYNELKQLYMQSPGGTAFNWDNNY